MNKRHVIKANNKLVFGVLGGGFPITFADVQHQVNLFRRLCRFHRRT